ncbi:MAG: TIGR03032 family protein [Gemmataceae bacterium]
MEKSEAASSSPLMTEARFQATSNFPHLLDQLGISLLVSTYQAGKLLVLGTHQGQLTVSFNHFERVMGVAVQSQRIAVGSNAQIWFLENTPDLARRIEPAGKYDACYLTRSGHVTGAIHGHELAWSGNELWVVNTLFSCLCTLSREFSFVPRWKPPFISELAPEDRCHLNGMALELGRPRYVTVMAECDSAAGWRPTKATSGAVIDVTTGQALARGFAMPHSPRLHEGHLWLLDSGRGRLVALERQSGKIQGTVELPGYTRGLSFFGPYAFIGLSRIRETSVFGGIPIAAQREQLKCGVAIVDLRSGRLVASFWFDSGVTEIFAVEVLPGVRYPATRGPSPAPEEGMAIWYAPGPVAIDAALPDISDTTVPDLVRQAEENRQQGNWDEAVARYRQALQVSPHLGEVAARLAQLLHEQGRLGEAVAAFEQALRLTPDRAQTLIHHANLLRDLDRPELAETQYRRALALEPANPNAHYNLAQLLSDQGLVENAAEHFENGIRIEPNKLARIVSKVMLPPIYRSMADLEKHRQRLIDNIGTLHAEGVTLDPTKESVPHLFYPVYQGYNDRDVHREFARLFHPAVDAGAAPRKRKRKRKKIRVGILSRFLCNHTIGKLNQGLVERLNRQRFHVTVLSAVLASEAVAQSLQEHADTYLVIPEHVPAACKQIAELDLDILYYTDIGMSPFTFTLAFSRLAPIQCVTWGHPQTTGIPTMDYFVSGEHLETAAGDEAYTEKLVRLRGLQTYYHRPKLEGPPCDRAYFNLPENANLYGCLQSLFKFHPEFDALLAQILRNDPDGLLLLVGGKYRQWNELLLQRWRETMPDVLDRVRFLPRMSRDEFLQLSALCQVMLDPIHFGGGNTTFEALSVGTPVVTLPSSYLRGRITYAQYQLMGMNDCIAQSAEDYVKRAVRLGTDKGYHQETRVKILELCPILFQNDDNIRAIEEFFESVV